MLAKALNSVVGHLGGLATQISLHTDDPGNLGENDSGETKQELTWSTPSTGWIKASATFPDVVGTFTHIGLWNDADEFLQGEILNVTLPTPQTLVVLVEFRVEVKA